MKSYQDVLGTVEGLKRGFTSGTSATAAAKGAAHLLTGSLSPDHHVRVELRNGMVLSLPLESVEKSGDSARAAVRKDSGDDDDITHNHLFCARVSLTETAGIRIIGGDGVGRVTRKGLPVAVGEWAINPGPLRMIESNLLPLCPQGKGFLVEITVPRGKELARKTWNPRLGIEGGISIIGTSGVIEPRSEKAYKASLILSARTIRAQGGDNIYLSPGYVGEGFYRKTLNLDDSVILNFGDAAGFVLNQSARREFRTVHLACHIGKMAKIAAGLFDTHCRTGDARLETVAALAGACGADQETLKALLQMRMAEEAVSLLEEKGLSSTFDMMAARSAWRIFKLWEKEYDRLPELRVYVLDLEGRCLNKNISHRRKDR